MFTKSRFGGSHSNTVKHNLLARRSPRSSSSPVNTPSPSPSSVRTPSPSPSSVKTPSPSPSSVKTPSHALSSVRTPSPSVNISMAEACGEPGVQLAIAGAAASFYLPAGMEKKHPHSRPEDEKKMGALRKTPDLMVPGLLDDLSVATQPVFSLAAPIQPAASSQAATSSQPVPSSLLPSRLLPPPWLWMQLGPGITAK